METVGAQWIGVVLSSHLLAALERVCDYLVVLVTSRVQVAGEVSELISSHHGCAELAGMRAACQSVKKSSRKAMRTSRARSWSAQATRFSARPGQSGQSRSTTW
jgi:ABC-type multidrug transport system ATPase subunit